MEKAKLTNDYQDFKNQNNQVKPISVELNNEAIGQKILQYTKKEGYYYNDQHYTNLEKEIIVGNIYFKNDQEIKLKNIDVKFNSKKFYNLTKESKTKNWIEFIELISPELMNFKDSYNGVLWTNAKNQEIYKIINIKVENNQLVITLELDNGYYFDDNDKSNLRIQLNYDEKAKLVINNQLEKSLDEYKKLNNYLINNNLLFKNFVVDFDVGRQKNSK